MKDVEALCKRAVVINEGTIIHDGPLEDIVDRFSKDKIIELQFADAIPDGLDQFGTVLQVEPPRVKLEVPRQDISSVLTHLLSNNSIEDVGVHERPLEEVIAELFTSHKSTDASETVSDDE